MFSKIGQSLINFGFGQVLLIGFYITPIGQPIAGSVIHSAGKIHDELLAIENVNEIEYFSGVITTLILFFGIFYAYPSTVFGKFALEKLSALADSED